MEFASWIKKGVSVGVVTTCACIFTAQVNRVIPVPQSMVDSESRYAGKPFGYEFTKGSKTFQNAIRAFQTDRPNPHAEFLKKVSISIDKKLAEEEYRLTLEGKSVEIKVGSKNAGAWALTTLLQLDDAKSTSARIIDKPTVGFRCVLIDVARRFHSMSTLRQIVRWCQAGKVRYLQLHLTDDQNWMLPTKVLKGIDRNNVHKQPTYTNQELKQLQAFASSRGVTIIPEVDMPGHSSLLVKYDPATYEIKGSASKGCINFGSSKVRAKMRELLREVAVLFPGSPYIHLGGDEAWYPDAEKDPEFMKVIGKLGQKAGPQEVFVDFLAEMSESILKSKRTPIVWEGFGRSEFAKKRIPKKTVVVAWEGDYYPPNLLAEDGYKIVNAGWDPLYVVNHYPYESFTLAPLPRLYQFNPQRFGIFNWHNEPSRGVDFPVGTNLLGSMMCWWEGHEWNARTTLPARILALGARLWNTEGEKDYTSFLARSGHQLNLIRQRTIPFHLMVVGTAVSGPQHFSDKEIIRPISVHGDLKFGIRTDKKVPKLSDLMDSIVVTDDTVLTIQAFRNGEAFGETDFFETKKVEEVDNLAYGKRVESSTQADPQFAPRLVTDGIATDEANYWLSYPLPSHLTIDLGWVQELNRIDVVAFWGSRAATQYLVEVSETKSDWRSIVDASKLDAPATKSGTIHRFGVQKARYIRLHVVGSKTFPPTIGRICEIRAFLEKGVIK